VVLVLLTGHGAARADERPIIRWDEQTVRVRTFAETEPYPLALAQLYASGQRAEAIARLEGWSEADMKAELVTLRSQMRKMGGHLPEGPLRAAVMLHTDREAYERLQSPVVETVRECGINQHGGYARSLIPLLVVQTDTSRDFARRWLMAMALSSQWDLCLDDVERWTREGLKWFPKDAELLLIQGTASETSATLSPLPGGFGVDQRRIALTKAARDLEAAVALDPDLHEARVRLGRVLWKLEKPAEARVALATALERAKDPWVLYLAHLFLARVLEDGKDLPGAVEHYRAALAIDPRAQAAAVGLSEVLLLQGEEGESREVMNEAMRHAPRAQPRDPYLSFHLGRANLAEEMLDALRQETLQ
jgi:tetratricopeptide (TPR) repeat protein